MSNEAQAFAGEPQSAGDSEYKAFLSVLASSARGRAFLAEHARRSRHADTEMLLAAMARIEDTLAEQRALAAASVPAQSAPPAVAPAATALAAIAAQAVAAAQGDLPEVKVIKAGSRPPPPHFAGEDFAGDAAVPAAPHAGTAHDTAAGPDVVAGSGPAERATPAVPPDADALAHLLALSEDERLALFS